LPDLQGKVPESQLHFENFLCKITINKKYMEGRYTNEKNAKKFFWWIDKEASGRLCFG
jgi:Ca2+-binding EF-hand superfamily protein